MRYKIPYLPLENIETIKILKKTISANKVIAELKGVAQTIPNQSILINTLLLQEAKDSSEVESIVTTHDELFKYEKNVKDFSLATKEVHKYNEAIYYGFHELKSKPITNNLLKKIVKILTGSDAGFRKLPGTDLKNSRGEIVYTPPQDFASISKYMKNLEQFINDPEMSDVDPLVKMAIIHHQFESIHPFYDGNGRTGRILNILYLILSGILDIPILYLSRYVIRNKGDYYRLLQKVRDQGAWEEWILYMLDALESTAKQTIVTINSIKKLMQEYKESIKESDPKIYSHELINTIFTHPYTKIEFVVKSTGVSRLTASKYLKKLVDIGLLELHKQKNTNYYINSRLLNLFISL